MSRHHWYIVSKSRIVPIVIRVVDWKWNHMAVPAAESLWTPWLLC
uniref:Uncharacterized protein n=1 Tax=Anguilla anguilla TaxID=7936 RepID=A0A0E9T8Z8_ANGAN